MNQSSQDILEMLEVFYGNASDGIIATDSQGNIEYINSKCRTYFNQNNKETFTNLFLEPEKISRKIVVLNEKKFLIRLFQKGISGYPENYIFTMLPNDEISDILPNSAYITQLKKQFQDILDCIHDVIYVTNDKGIMLMANKAVERYGIKREDIVGIHVSELVKENFMKESLVLKVLKTKKCEGYISHEPEGYDLFEWGVPHFNNDQIDLIVCTEWDIEKLNNMKELINFEEKIPSNIQSELAYYRMRSLKANEIIAESPQMKNLMQTAARIARSDSTILIQGESGTGKEVLMKYIQSKSPRVNSPLIEVNCGAIPENLIESELFGYEQGAFTGANPKGKLGFFELANKGTLFLDEIGELPFPAQTKLLRAIQQKEILKVGGNIPSSIDVRIIAATNVNLTEAVEERKFRKDLFYRLNVIPLYIPPLRERKEDIPQLIQYFIYQYNLKYKTNKVINKEDLDIFINYTWPGNIRELQNLIERVLLTTHEDMIPRKNWLQHLPFNPQINEVNIEQKVHLKDEMERFEKNLLLRYLPLYKSSRQFAELLGVEKTSIIRKFKKYNIKI